MRKSLFLLYFTLAASLLYSCKKDHTSVNGNNNNNNNQTDNKPEFMVNGVSDVSFTSGVGTMGLQVAYVSGPQAVVNLSLSSLPAGVEAKFSSKSGTPSFGSVVTFHTTGQTGGTYPITLTAQNSATSRNYSFNLHLGARENCAKKIVSEHHNETTNNDCLNNYAVTVEFSEDPSVLGRVRMALNRATSGEELRYKYSFYTDVDCLTMKGIIPLQSIGYNKEVSGTADFSGFPARVDLTIKDASGATSECYMIFL